MKSFTMCIFGAIPNGLKGQEYFYSLVLVFCLLTLSGCVTSHSTASIAPLPPQGQHEFIETDASLHSAHYFVPVKSEDSAALPYADIELYESNNKIVSNLSLESDVQNKCRLKDRFDREAILAYEWNRSRFALDVDGIGGGGDQSGARIQYTIRLQPEKTDKQKCRYKSSWQGLMGSGYNEFILRKENTVIQEINVKRAEGAEFISSLF